MDVGSWRPDGGRGGAQSERGRRPIIPCFPLIQSQRVGWRRRSLKVFSVQSGIKRRPFRSAARSSIMTGVPLDSYIFMNGVRRSVGHVIYGGAGSKRSQTAEPRPPTGRPVSSAGPEKRPISWSDGRRGPRPITGDTSPYVFFFIAGVKCHATLKGLDDLHAGARITCTIL